LRATVRTRPDLAERLASGALSTRDRKVLHETGFAATGDDVAH
jgi:hypothetical protein